MKWNKFKFTLHPKEFEKIFENLEYYVIENYQIKDKASIFSEYQLYYNKITSGNEWKNDDWKLNIHLHLTNNIRYKKDEKIKTFKHSIQTAPLIHISAFSLQLDNKERLTVKFFDINHNSNIGLQISYPKEIISSESGEIISTENLSNHRLYLELIKRIKKVSKKAKAKRNNNISRPNFWISSKCLNEINRNVMIYQNLITLE